MENNGQERNKVVEQTSSSDNPMYGRPKHQLKKKHPRTYLSQPPIHTMSYGKVAQIAILFGNAQNFTDANRTFGHGPEGRHDTLWTVAKQREKRLIQGKWVSGQKRNR
jgi:hypothetical protein